MVGEGFLLDPDSGHSFCKRRHTGHRIGHGHKKQLLTKKMDNSAETGSVDV